MRHLVQFAAVVLLTSTAFAADPPSVEPWRAKLYQDWKALPDPPVTPYDGPFGNDARAFTVRDQQFIAANKGTLTKEQLANLAAINDYRKSAKNGVYDPKLDPRPINAEFETAILEDWNRMGYNTAYKGGSFTFMVGSFLKQKGLLGAIDQTLFGANGPPPEQFDGKQGQRQREACGSFFHPENFQAGLDAITGMGHAYGHHLFTVGNHRLTCSWDEVGMRTRAQMDYRDPMRQEFRRFLREVWFQDAAPGQDTNRDGRTYNAFTGQSLKSWDEVEPVHVSLDWTLPGYDQVKKDGTRTFSAMPDVDTVMFREPARYKLLVDFHRYFTFEFFRRINEESSQAMNRLRSHHAPRDEPSSSSAKTHHAERDGYRVSCYPFTQHFIIWPGANQRHGNSFYWYHRLSPVVNVEHCWPDAPVMNLNYAITDRLAPRHRNAVMGWIWFYFGQEGHDMYNGPHDIDRALARMMGHNVDGTHHWLYSPRYRSRDQQQRLQIAYWQNFFRTHYAGLLSRAAPVRPQVALLMPDYTGYFYRYFQYPKQDFAWTAEALQNLQLPYDLLTEEELELGETRLGDYKVLYVVGSEWSTPTIRQRIAEFLAQGGVVFANVDSLSLDIATGKRTDFLEKHFGVQIVRKHKNAFFPSTQTAEEAVWSVPLSQWAGPFTLQGHMVHQLDDPRAWAKLWARTPEKYVLGADGKLTYPIPDNQGMRGGQPVRDPSWKMLRGPDGKLVRDEAVWKELDAVMAKMPTQVHGVPQSPLDMRSPPMVRYALRSHHAPRDEPSSVPSSSAKAHHAERDGYVSWSEVDEAKPLGSAKPIAWWNDKIVGLETANTVWLGTREGMSIHALSSRMEAHRATEPCNPFPSAIPDTYEAIRPHVEALGYAATKAGVVRPVTFLRDGQLPMNLEILPRVAPDGTLLVIAISHDKTEADYDVTIDASLLKPLANATAWNLLTNREIEPMTDGRFTLRVPSWGVSVFVVAQPSALKPIQAAQAKLMAKDLSVPKYFVDRPELNQGEWGTPVPTGK